MEKPKRKNSEKPKHKAKYIPDHARDNAIIMTCFFLFIPTGYAGLLILFDYGWQCQFYSSVHTVWWILGIMLFCIVLFLWWMPQFIAEHLLLVPTHLKITLITIITTAILIAILTAIGIWLPCLPI